MHSAIDTSLTIERLQFMPENQFFDRKSARLPAKELSRHISAMANASGGVVAVGIEDKGEITGVSVEAENEFRKVPLEFFPVPPLVEIEALDCDGKTVLLFHIAPSTSSVVTLRSGETYLRSGDSSRKLSPEQYVSLEYSRGIRSFESTIVRDATIEDLDTALMQEYCNILNPGISTPFDILKARGLIKQKDGAWQVTVAAILLFGKYPTQFLPSARLRFLRYEGTSVQVGRDFNVVKDITLEKPLHQLLSEAKLLLSTQMREFQQLGMDGKFKKIPEYPEFAWLEGLVNAVTHRDYSISGDYIRISMFDDRIEFSSPGCLPSIVTVKNIRTTRFSRNPLIARVLSDFGWVRELNEGVKRIYTDMEAFFLEPPEFSEPNKNTVLLVLKNNIAMRSMRKMESLHAISIDEWTKLKPLDQLIIYVIANCDHCTPKMLEHATQRSRQTILSHIKKLLVENGGPIEEHASSPSDPTKYYTVT